MKYLSRPARTIAFIGICSLLSACGMSKPSPPKGPPISLNELSNSFSALPRCDSDVPSCKVSLEETSAKAFEEANSILSSRPLSDFIIEIDNIRKSDEGGWDVRGKVAWDLARENASAATGVGLALGAATVLGGGSVMDGVGAAALATKGTYDSVGKCITSTQTDHKPSTTISVFIKGLQILDLGGVEEGSYLLVRDVIALPFKPGVGFGSDRHSVLFVPTATSFGDIAIEANGGVGIAEGTNPHTERYCISK